MSTASTDRHVLDDLQALILREIPLTRHLDFDVRARDGRGLVLGAPLGPNINHKATAFGGSLGMLLTLAGWGTVQLLLRSMDAQAQVVIQRSEIAFLHPVRHDFEAVCAAPDDAARARFAASFRRWGRARIALSCTVTEENRTAVRFTGTYVALQPPETDPSNR